MLLALLLLKSYFNTVVCRSHRIAKKEKVTARNYIFCTGKRTWVPWPGRLGGAAGEQRRPAAGRRQVSSTGQNTVLTPAFGHVQSYRYLSAGQAAHPSLADIQECSTGHGTQRDCRQRSFEVASICNTCVTASKLRLHRFDQCRNTGVLIILV